ncbi:hypothetical protein ACH4C6_15565 [Streptomyces sp. NPDC017943]|uniref:hypothetical protein n=1 Tax=Streptomyces sp. NPDC017943 TaxID=3365019 RepID=UPI003788ED50
MGKSASREERGRSSSFSMSYEGGRRDPSTHVKLGRLSYKGPATAVVALAVVAAGGVVGYQLLAGQDGSGGTGSGPGTSVSSGPEAAKDTGGPDAGGAGPGPQAADAGATSAPPASGSSATGGSGRATPAADGGPAAGAVREHRKVVLRSASNMDLDFADAVSDITFTMPSGGNGWSLVGDSGDLATVDGPATAESCAAATDFGFTIDRKNIAKGLTACVLTDENRVAAITVLGWQKDDNGLSSVTMDVTLWEKPEAP